MKSRLTVACSLVVLITVVLAAIQPTLVLGQPSNKVYLPLIRALRPYGFPVFEQPEQRTLYPGETTFYEVTLKNTGTVVENFLLQVRQDDQATLDGVSASLVNQSNVFLGPQQDIIITVKVSASASASFGTDTRVLRASAASTEGIVYADVPITTIVSQRPTGPTQIRNGDFEQGRTEWREGTGSDMVPVIEQSTRAHSGVWQANLVTSPDEDGFVGQTVFVTDQFQALSFWYKIESNDQQCDNAAGPSLIADFARVSAFAPTYNGPGQPSTGKLFVLCDTTDTDGQWVYETLDVRQFVGYEVNISFNATTNQFGVSHFYVDDVQLIAVP